MAICIPGPLVSEIHGSVGGINFYNHQGKQCIRRKLIQKRKHTPEQALVTESFKKAQKDFTSFYDATNGPIIDIHSRNFELSKYGKRTPLKPFQFFTGYRYFLNKLTKNFDFSDQVINGDMTTDTDWIKGAGWTWLAGHYFRNSGFGYTKLEQALNPSTYHKYKITYTVNILSGWIHCGLGGAAGPQRVVPGTYTEIITAVTNGNLYFGLPNSGAVISLDDVSCYDISYSQDIPPGQPLGRRECLGVQVVFADSPPTVTVIPNDPKASGEVIFVDMSYAINGLNPGRPSRYPVKLVFDQDASFIQTAPIPFVAGNVTVFFKYRKFYNDGSWSKMYFSKESHANWN